MTRRVIFIKVLFLLAVFSHSSKWNFIAGGDLMLNQISAQNNPLLELKDVFSQCEIVYCNLETPLTTSITPTKNKSKEDLRQRVQYILKSNPQHAKFLNEVGINLVSLGNNHTMDFGVRGLSDTINALDENNMQYTGAGSDYKSAFRPAIIKTSADYKVGMLSFLAFMGTKALQKCTMATSYQAGIAGLDLKGIIDQNTRKYLKEIVESTKQKCDFLFISMHWGYEKKEIPRLYQIQLGRAFIDAGADLIVGSHPHVLQGAEIYKGKPILYSLGNLLASKNQETSLIKLSFVGDSLDKFTLIPCKIKNRRVLISTENRKIKQKEYFGRLCDKLARKFPHKYSSKPNILVY